MKKIIATALALCMTLAVFASLSVTAAYTSVPSTVTHTYEMMDSATTTGLDAYYWSGDAAPTIDDSAWDSVLGYRHAQNATYTSTNETIAYVAVVKFMWDEDNLYVLQTVDNGGKYADNIGDELGTSWNNEYTWNPNGKDCDISSYNIMLPASVSTNTLTSLVVAVSPNLSGVGETVSSFVRTREIKYPSDKGGYVANSAITGYSRQTSDGYVMETVIPWSAIGTAPNAGQEIGVKFNPTGFGYHVNHNVSGVDGDRYGHDPVTLMEYTPDMANWAITDKTFASAKTNEDGAYLIEDAADLLGLSYALAAVTDDGIAKALTEGKTFLITNDIDLNPNVDWDSFSAGTSDVPQEWRTINRFYGTLDGQGHWVKGIYHVNESDDTEFGLIGHLKGGAIKNIRFDNGYMTTKASKDGGFVVGTLHTGTSALENIYVGENVTVLGIDGKKTGGVVGGSWSSPKNPSSMTNVVFAGTVSGGTVGGIIGNVQTPITFTDVICHNTAYSFEGTINKTNGGALLGARYGAANTIGEYEGAWIDTEMGVLPVAVADMFSTVYWQTTVETDGKFGVRILGEIASLNYESVDFKVTITDKNGKSAVWGYGASDKNGNAYALAKVAYNSVLANGETKTATDLNAGILDGEDNAIYTLTLNGLDAANEYKIYVTTVWTLTDGTAVSGAVEHLVTPAPTNVN